MTMEDIEHWCKVARSQRELTQGQDMIPILAVETDDGMQVFGLAGEPSVWPDMLIQVREQFHPTAAVLTVDTFLRILGPDETFDGIQQRPSQDPRAGSCLWVMRATADGSDSRYLPYAVNDDGSYTWLDSHQPSTVRSPVSIAMEELVR